MPGVRGDMLRPVGYAVIVALNFVRVRHCSPRSPTYHTVPYGKGFSMQRSQAFHAWLPSSSPDTMRVRSYFDGNGRPTLLHVFAPYVLASVLWFSCLCQTGAIQLAKPSNLGPQHRLNIRVQANVFGKVNPADIAVVLRSAGSEIFRYCPHTQLAGIDVYYRSDHPEIDSKRTSGGRIAMALSARNTHWAQYSFQFSHEFCHALANYADGSQPTLSDQPNANLWLEESLCETASLFSLQAMSRTWEIHPPYPALRAYAPWFADYVQQRLALPEHRLPASFSTWFRQHQSALRKEAGQRDWNTIIAKQLLPIFEEEPAGWEAVTFLNRSSSKSRQSLSEHFAQWRANCPDRLRPFVSKVAAVFEVTLR